MVNEWKNLQHNRGLQRHGNRSVHYVGEGPGSKAALDSAQSEGMDARVGNVDKDGPAEMASCALVANNLHEGGNTGSWKPFQQQWKKREKKESRHVSDLLLTFREFIRTHGQG